MVRVHRIRHASSLLSIYADRLAVYSGDVLRETERRVDAPHLQKVEVCRQRYANQRIE